jgi:hypothetical protein
MRGRVTFLLACVAAAIAPLFRTGAVAAEAGPLPDPPATFEGRALRRVDQSDVTRAFASEFPGRLATFTDGERMIVWRHVVEPTRRMHALSYCYRCAGYVVEPLPAIHDATGAVWGRFAFESDGARFEVREAVVDADGARFTDVSSWWWSAAVGASRGPWTAWAVVERADADRTPR